MAYTRPFRSRVPTLLTNSQGIPTIDPNIGRRMRYPMPKAPMSPSMLALKQNMARRKFGTLNRPNPYGPSNPYRQPSHGGR